MASRKLKKPKIDCFAYQNERSCRALNQMICSEKDKCPFYKHKSEISYEEIERAIERYVCPKTIKF